MNIRIKYIFYCLLFTFLNGCKTQEVVPEANYYKPVFDQTKKEYIRTASNQVNLDTLVLIRSNLREVDEVFEDTFRTRDQFIITMGELAVPVELINEKPPTYDTSLIVADYRFTAAYVNSVFPVIPDSLRLQFGLVSDSLAADTLNLVADSLKGIVDSTELIEEQQDTSKLVMPEKTSEVKKKDLSRFIPAFLLSKEKREARKSRKEIDRNLQLSQERKTMQDSLTDETVAADSIQEEIAFADTVSADTIESVTEPEKLLYTREEILSDSTRDLLDADIILNKLIADAVWFVGDTIPVYQISTNYFLDSSLVLYFDTLFVKVFDSTKVVPQLPFEELVEEQTDTIVDNWEYQLKEVITFKVFHPEIDDVYMPMVKVQGGTFKIGSNEFDEDERPAYKLRVSNFLLGKYEVTNRLFCYFLNDMRCDSLGYIDGLKVIDLFHPLTKIKQDPVTEKFFTLQGYDDYPVVNVAWIGAQMFCKIYGGRLPTEAEWEYAAKGGIYAKRVYTNREKTDYDYVNRFAGGNYMGDLGWFVDNSRGQVWAGGKKLPNEMGLYDMCGNVWEWCYDQYDKTFYRRNNKSKNPMCLDGGLNRVNRGGSWSSDATYCRITNRNYLNQYRYNQYLGFRYMREWR